MSLLRKIKRNFHFINRSQNSKRKLSQKAKRQSRIVLDALEPRVMLAADLEALLMPADFLAPDWGESADFYLEVTNNGTDLSTGTANVDFYLDADQSGTLDIGSDYHITTVDANTIMEPETPSLPLDFTNDSIPSGKTLGGQYTLTLPASGYSDGDYAIFVSIDDASISDSDTSNNVSSFTIPIGPASPTGGIELNLSKAFVPAIGYMDELAYGGIYSASASVHNVGDTNAGSTVNVSFFISHNMYLTPDAQLLTTDGTNPATVATSGTMDAGTGEVVTVDVQMPASNPFGVGEPMYIVAVADATGISSGVPTGGTVTEVYESNNLMPIEKELELAASSSVTGVDLAAGRLYFGDIGSEQVPNYIWGQTGTAAANIQYYNAGDSAATGFDVEVVISPSNDVADTNAVSLVASSGAAITADSLAFGTESLTPSPVPDYFGDTQATVGWAYAFAKIDASSQNETGDTSNNISGPTRIWMGDFDSTDPDLSPYDISLSHIDDEEGLYWGDTVDINSLIANVGVATNGVNNSAPITVTFYLHDNEDTNVTTSFTPVELGSTTIETDILSGELVGAALNQVTLVRPASLSSSTPTQYYIVAEVDGGTAVATEAAAAPNTYAVKLKNEIYDVKPEIRMHTNAPAADWLIPPTVGIELGAYRGLEQSSNSIDVKFYLSPDQTLETGSDDLVGTYTFNFNNVDSTLAANSAPLTAEFALDFSGVSQIDGDYTVFATLSSASGITFADDEDTTDSFNIPVGDIKDVTGMEIVGISAELPEYSEAVWSGSYDVALVIGNAGDTDLAAGVNTFDVEAYLSFDNTLDADDISVGSAYTVTSGIVAGSETVVAYTITLPAEAAAITAWGEDTVNNVSGYQVIFALDTNDAITETFNYNNYITTDYMAIADSASATPTAIDIAGQQFFSPELAIMFQPVLEWGDTLDVYSNFENIGPSDETAGLDIHYYLSPTETLPTDIASDPDIIELSSSDNVASLASGAVTNASFAVKTLTIPSMPVDASGSYYLIARAVSVTGDSDLTNNDIAITKLDGSAMAIDMASPDLMPMDDSDAPEYKLSWKFGSTYEMALDLFNSGQLEVSSVVANMYLSAIEPDTSSLTVSDLETDSATYYKLTSDYSATFSTGEFESINDVSVTLPSSSFGSDGVYYLITAVDTNETIDEFDEDNNINFIPINIQSDTSLTGKDISIIDFDVENLSSSDSKDTLLHISSGDSLYYDYLVYNAGIATGAGFDVEYRLTTDGDFDGSSESLGTSTIASSVDALGLVGDSSTLTFSASVSDGLYYVVARADSAYAISDEPSDDRYNNDSYPIPVYVGSWASGTMDLVVLNTDVSLNTGERLGSYKPGDTVNVDFDIVNVGDTQAQPFTVEFYLSDDGVADVGELITPDNFSPANPGALDGSGSIMAMSAQLTIPTPANTSASGDYQLIIKVVPNGADTGEVATNNETSQPLTLDLPDLAITSTSEFLSDPTVVDYIWGQTGLEIELELSNEGDSYASAFNVRLVISADATYDSASDLELAIVSLDGLAAGSTYHEFVDITIPEQTSGDIPTSLDDGNAATNTYYILAVVDSGTSGNSYAGVIDEIDETNNLSTQALTITDSSNLTLQTGVSDLTIVDSWVDDMAKPAWGNWLPVELSIYNDGEVDAGPFDIQFALSADTVWDGSGTDIIIDSYYGESGSGTAFTVSSLASASLSLVEGLVRIPDYVDTYTETSYKLIARIDSDANADNSAGGSLGDVDETGFETNNDIEPDSNIAITQPAVGVTDIMSSILLPTWDPSSDISPGGSITVVAGVYNNGDTDADPGVNTIDAKFYLVSTSVPKLLDETGNVINTAIELTAASEFAVSISSSPILPAGSGYEQNMTLTIPDTAAPGSYYLAMLVDSSESITETNDVSVPGELNNTMVLTEPDFIIDLGSPVYDLEVASSSDIAITDINGTVLTGTPILSSEMDSFSMNVTVTNNGVTAAAGYKVSLGLYSDQAMTQLVAGTSLVADGAIIAGGTTSDVFFNGLNIPNTIAAGDYYYGITLDSYNSLDESGVSGGETNNTITVPVTIESPRPDISLSYFKVADMMDSLEASPGDILPVHIELNNMSIEAVDSVFMVSVELVDSTGTPVTGAKWDQEVSNLPAADSPEFPGPMVSIDFNIYLPFDLDTTETYTLVAKADSGAVIDEIDEDTNNVSQALTVTLKEPEVDIVLQPLYIDTPYEGKFFWGSEFYFSFQLNEFGNSASPQCKAAVYLSSAADSIEGALLLGEYDLPELQPGSFHSVDTSLVLPDNADASYSDGDYYIVVYIDSNNDVPEMMNGVSAEDNNIRSAMLQIGSPNVDIALDDQMGTEIFEVIRSVPFDVRLGAYNNSLGMIDTPFTVRAVASLDNVFGNEDDYFLAETVINHLDPYSSYEENVMVSWPDEATLADGTYRIIIAADVDNVITETNSDGTAAEDNNQSVFYVELTTLDLVDGIDLIGGDFDMDGISNFSWGESYNTYFGLMNNGMEDAGEFDVEIYLSKDNTYSADSGDISLGSYTLAEGLGSGQVYMGQMDITLPDNADGTLNDGPYFMIFITDSGKVINDVDLANNSINKVISMGNLPNGTDFEIGDVELNTDANYGDSFTVSVPVSNNGAIPAWAQLSVYASTSPITMNNLGSAWMLGSYDLTDGGELGAGQSVTVDITIDMPWGPQDASVTEETYNILIVVDAQNMVQEIDETNNGFYHSYILTQELLPDLEAWPVISGETSGSYIPGIGEAFSWGDQLTIDAHLNNWGDADVTDSFKVSYYLSSLSPWDSNFNTSDLYQLTSKTVTSIAAGENTIVSGAVVVLPETAPDRFADISNLFIVSMVDSVNVIDELNEDNNYSDMPIYIGTVPADLGGYLEIRPEAGMDYPDMNYTWGETVPLTINLQNYGGGDAENFQITYYLSQDWTFQNSDGTIETSKLVEVGSQDISLVEAGVGSWDYNSGTQIDSAKYDFELTLPSEKPAEFTNAYFGYNIIAVIDSGNVVTEYDENWNNVTSNYINIEESSSDLVSYYVDPLDPETGEFKPDAIWSDQTITRQVMVRGNIANNGNSDADNITVAFYLANSTGDLSNAYELGREVITSLTSDAAFGNNAEFSYVFDIPQPENVPFVISGQETGAYTIVMLVDPDNEIVETTEDNNVTAHPFRLTKQTGRIYVSDSIGDPSDKEMDFGKLLPGDSYDAFVTIFNNGDGALNINALDMNNDVFSVGDIALPLLIEPGMSMDIPVTLNTTGQEPGLQEGIMTIQTNDPRKPDGVAIDLMVEIAQSPIDLQVEYLTASAQDSEAVADDFADAYWGDAVNISVSVNNISDVDTQNGVFVDIFLVESMDEGAQRYMLHSNYSINDLTAGTGQVADLDLVLPQESPFGFSGQLYIAAEVYGDITQDYETNYNNNYNGTPLVVTSKPEGTPEIAFTYTDIPEELAPGAEATVDFGLFNSGKADAGAFDVAVYLSNDGTLGATDILVGNVNLQGLSVDTEKGKSLTFTLPEDTTEGLKYIILSADASGVLNEGATSDNVSVVRFNVEKGPEVDLLVSDINVNGDVLIGQEFALALTVDNVGTQDTSDVSVDLFLKSASSTVAGSGTFIGAFVIDTISAGSSFDAEYQLYLPFGQVQSGVEYTISAVVDMAQTIEEIDETNNTGISDSIIPSIGSIDLSGVIDAIPAEGTWGDGFEVSLAIANTGEVEATAFNVKVVLSSDNVVDENDFYLTSWTSGGLGAGESESTNLWAYLPDYMNLADGDYYVLAKLDSRNNVEETDESNNLVASTPISVAGMPELYGYLTSVPQTANYGQTISITDSVSNYGTSASGEFEVTYYLSQDYEYNAGVDVRLGSRIISSLAAEAVNDGTIEFELDQPVDWPDAGQMYIVMVVDEADAVQEKYEGQDGTAYIEYNSMPIEILSEGKADLQAVSVSALTAASYNWTADPADPSVISIQYEIDNNGTAPSDQFGVSFYLSTNSLITADKDYYLGSTSIVSLGAEMSLVDFAEFELPLESYTGNDGEFYIGMIVDREAVIDEIVEDNNNVASASTVEIGDIVKIDLVANDIYGPYNGILPGEDFDIYAGVFNAGSEPSDSFAIDIYLTSSGLIDGTSVKIDTVTMDPVNAGSYLGQHFTISGLTAEALDGFVGASAIIAMDVNPADNDGLRVMEESLYNNNQAYDYAMTAISEPIIEDAVAVSLSSTDDLSDLAWGDSISLDYTVTPITDASMDLQLILKNSAVGNELVLASWTVPADSSDITDSIGVTLPDYSPFGHDGDLDIVLSVDYNSQFSETSENNNQLSIPVSVGSGMADLAALDISSEPTAAAGDSVKVYSGVANYGNEDAFGFEIYYYLTTDNTQIDQANDIMLTSSYISSLNGMEYFWDAPTVTIPNSVADGSYYLAMLVDKYDDIEEAFEDNNTSFSYMPVQIKSETVTPDSNEPDNQLSSANSVVITNGRSSTITATIHEQGNSDFYSFVTPSDANGLAVISVIPDEYLNTAMTVYDQTGSVIASVDLEPFMGGEEIFTSFSLSPGRSYYVEVEGVGASLGEYEMEIMLGTGGTAGDSYETNNTLATASYIGSEDVVITDVNIHKTSDQDYYMFTVSGDSTGEFWVDAVANPELDLVMRLYDSTGLQIASSDIAAAGSDEGIEYQGQPGDVYYVAFSSWAGSTGGYGFGVGFEQQALPDGYESNETSAEAYSLVSKSTFSIYDANINTATDIDYYSIIVPAGSTSLKLDIYGDIDLDSAVSVYSSNGRLLKSEDRGGIGENETISVGSLTAGQTVYIAVDGLDSTTGYYGLNGVFSNTAVGDFAEPNESADLAYDIELINTSKTIDSLSIDKQGDTDFFAFILPADSDGTISITGTPVSTGLNLQLRLRDADGVSIKVADITAAGQAEVLAVTGLTPGDSYYISVKGWDTTGNYKLKIDTPRSSAAMADQPDNNIAVEFISPLPALTAVVGPMPATAEGTVVIEQVGTVNDDILSFGTASSGTTSSGTMTIRNTSSAAQTYTLAIAGDDAFTVSSSSVTVAAGSSQDVTVAFSPVTTGSVSGTLTVTDGSAAVVGSLPLSGTGTVTADKPDIQIVDSTTQEISALEFDTTEPEDYSEQTFRIRNLGSSNLTIASASITGTNVDVFSVIGNLSGRTVANGTPLTVRLAFEPLTVGNKTANLVLVTNDPDEPTVTIPLSATAGTAVLGVSVDEVDFDTVLVDGTGESIGRKAVTLSNSGNTTLNIDSFEFGNSAFSITDVSGNTLTSLDIAAGASVQVYVVFDPTIEGAVIDTLEFDSNDNDSPAIILTADGITGVTSEPLQRGVMYFNDTDGDIFKILYSTSGDMTFSAESSVDDTTLAGATLSVDVLGALGRGFLKVRDINSGVGDGVLNFDSITIDGSFRFIDVQGEISELDIAGSMAKLIAAGVGDANIDGTVGAMLFTDGLNGADISVGNIRKFIARGDVANSNLTTTTGNLGVVAFAGDADMDITSAGKIGYILGHGDFSGDVSAEGYLGKVKVMGAIEGGSWNIGSDTNSAVVRSIYGHKGIDIDSMLVNGSLGAMTAGSRAYQNGVAGNISADRIGVVRVYGDLDAIITADSYLGRWALTGDVLDNAHVYEGDQELTD